jgi:hypothetical protein
MAIFVSALMVFGLLAFWIADRKRLVRRLELVAAQQRELDFALNGFMQESERIAIHFSRLLSANQGVAPAPSVPERKSIDKRDHVLGLAQKGTSGEEIARRLMIPRAEVELILNLNARAS